MKSARKEVSAVPRNAAPWPIDSIVAELRTLRVKSLEARSRGDRPPRLPSRKALAGIVDGVSAALFPNRLGSPDLTDAGVDYFVGHTLEVNLRLLHEQLTREFQFSSGLDRLSDVDRERAIYVTHAFAQYLPKVRSQLESDLVAAFEGDPAARTVDEVLVCYPGITAITHYRLAHSLYCLGAPLVARMISELAHSATGIDIHPGAHIGGRFFIDHGTGVVIGETAVLGDHVRLYQAVTLGAKRFHADSSGALVKGEARHPVVEDDVVIYAGATILGRVTIGRGSTIGGNVWLTRSVPSFSNVSQANALDELIVDGSGI
jgi:serine O-acetyltransferase